MPVDLRAALAGETEEARETFKDFYNYATSGFNNEQVYFLMLVRAFQGLPVARNLFASNCVTKCARANFIYTQCIRVGSKMEINVIAEIKIAMSQSYPQGGFQPETNEDPQALLSFFDKAYSAVFDLVEADIWLRFKSRALAAASQPAWANSTPAARKQVAPKARKNAVLRSAQLMNDGLNSAFAALMASPLLNVVSLPPSVAAAAPAAASPARQAFVPYPSAAPAAMWSASASASSPTPALAATPAKVVTTSVPVMAAAAPAGTNVHQVPLLQLNPPPYGKRLLPQSPTEQARRKAALDAEIAALQAQNPPPPPTSPVPSRPSVGLAPAPPTSPVPSMRPAIPKQAPHRRLRP